MRQALVLFSFLLLAGSLYSQSTEDAARDKALLEALDLRSSSALSTAPKGGLSLLRRRASYYLGSPPLSWSSSFRSEEALYLFRGGMPAGIGLEELEGDDDESTLTSWLSRHGWRDPLFSWRLVRDQPIAAEPTRDFREAVRGVLEFESEAPDERRSAAAYGLMRAGTEEDLQLALGLLETGSPGVAAPLARLLGRIGGEKSVGPLVATVLNRKERTVRVNALRALGAIGDRGGVVAVAAMMKSDDPHLQRTALEALDRIVEKNGLAKKERRGLTAFVWALLTRDPVLDVRRAAVKPLARLSPKSFRLFLVRARQHEPWALRAEAARALAREATLDWLWIDRFLADPDRRVAGGAVDGLSARVDNAEVQKRLWRVVEKGTDDIQLELALTALTTKLAPSAGPLTEAPDNLRGRLWRAVERVYRTLPPSQAESKQACLKAARLLEDERSRAFLDEVARDDSEYAIRNFARRHLVELGVPQSEIPPATLAAEHPQELRDLAWSFHQGNGPKDAVITTEKGEIVLKLEGAQAPFTCAVFTTLARQGFYDGLLFHRVIPDFVAQAGCPRGDGWGGPGFSQRCEINGLEYRRGTVGMALAGQDTGGSQFFICFQPQPHLDGRYTIFGQVTEGWEVLDALTQGARIDAVTVE